MIKMEGAGTAPLTILNSEEEMAPRTGSTKSRKSQQSISLSEDVVRQIEEEAMRQGLKKSQIIDQILSEKLKKETDDENDGRPKIVVFMNHKGGVGKTISAVNVASCLAEEGHQVLIIDMDEQGNASRYLDRYDEAPGAPCIADVLFTPADGRERMTLDEVTVDTKIENLYIVPSNFRFSEPGTMMTGAGADSRLYYAIEDMEQVFDYIIIDCGPRLDITVTNAIISLGAGHENSFVVVVAKIEEFANEGVRRSAMMMKRIAQERRVQPCPWVILQTAVESRTNAYKEGLKKLKTEMPGARFFLTHISKSTAIPESSMLHLPMNHYDPGNKVTLEYRTLTREIENMYE